MSITGLLHFCEGPRADAISSALCQVSRRALTDMITLRLLNGILNIVTNFLPCLAAVPDQYTERACILIRGIVTKVQGVYASQNDAIPVYWWVSDNSVSDNS